MFSYIQVKTIWEKIIFTTDGCRTTHLLIKFVLENQACQPMCRLQPIDKEKANFIEY